MLSNFETKEADFLYFYPRKCLIINNIVAPLRIELRSKV